MCLLSASWIVCTICYRLCLQLATYFTEFAFCICIKALFCPLIASRWPRSPLYLIFYIHLSSFLCFICLWFAMISIVFPLYMHQSSLIPLTCLYLPAISIVLLIVYVSRNQNKFQIRKKAGIQGKENGHIYQNQINTWSMHLVKSFKF